MRRVENANQSAGPGTFNNYNFDFGLGNGLTKGLSNAPLKDQKQSGFGSPWTTPQAPKPAASHSVSSGLSGYQAAAAGWSGQAKSSGGVPASSSESWGSSSTSSQTGWAGYQPMTQGLGGAKSAAQTLGGGSRSMNAAAMNPSIRSDLSKLTAAGIAGAQSRSKGDDVFGDLFGAALSRSNVPLKTKTVSKPSFAMGNLDSTRPKTEEPVRRTGQSMASMGRSAPAPEARRPESNPFPPVSTSTGAVSSEDDFFSFAGSSNTNVPASSRKLASDDPFGLSGSSGAGNGGSTAGFNAPSRKANAPSQRAAPSAKSAPFADPFDILSQVKSSSSSGTRKAIDPLEALLSKAASAPSKPPPPAPVQDDSWGVFGDSAGGSSLNEPTTTELEGLPPPPNGVTVKAANEKGSEYYKNGQFPDAIKWLSWSFELLKSSPDSSLMLEVLTCRISCFKEIGEMKKAVADCSQAIKLQPTSTVLIMLRANLYESMEKYKLAVADLKLVLKIEPDHRQARATLTRLEKIIG